MPIEFLARALADLNRRRSAADDRRRVVHDGLARARSEMAALARERSLSARIGFAHHVFSWAGDFVQSDEGRWAFERWYRWRIAWDLDLDSSGHFWRAEDAHSFGRAPAVAIRTPMELAVLYPTDRLRDAVAATERNFWAQALSREIVHLVLPRGRPV